MTTIANLTIAQIRKLSTEAHLAGDRETFEACNTIYSAYQLPETLDLADALDAYPEQAARIVAVICLAEAQ